MHKVITDKDGRMRTENVVPPPSAEEMGRFRQNVHDHISGNVGGWHADEFAKPKEEPPLKTWDIGDQMSIYDDPDWAAFMPDAEERN